MSGFIHFLNTPIMQMIEVIMVLLAGLGLAYWRSNGWNDNRVDSAETSYEVAVPMSPANVNPNADVEMPDKSIVTYVRLKAGGGARVKIYPDCIDRAFEFEVLANPTGASMRHIRKALAEQYESRGLTHLNFRLKPLEIVSTTDGIEQVANELELVPQVIPEKGESWTDVLAPAAQPQMVGAAA